MREVLGGYSVAMREALHLQGLNSIRRGSYYPCFDKRSLIYKTAISSEMTAKCHVNLSEA